MQVISGIQKDCKLIILYGPPGVGKTTLSALAPRPVIVDLEHGSNHLDCSRINDIKNADDMGKIYKWFCSQQDYDTLVIDSLTKLEQLLSEGVLKDHGWKNLEEPGYGKGYAILAKAMTAQIKAWEYITKTVKKNVIVVAHSTILRIEDPMLAPYDSYSIHINKNSRETMISSADCVFFYKQNTRVKDKEGRKAVTSGDRELYTVGQPAFVAKTRTQLDEIIDNPGREFWSKLME